MKYPTVSVNGVSVRVDEDGRYNLNDLHAAAVANGEATESQRPSNFLRSAQIKRFISALKAKAQKRALKEIQPLKVIKGGVDSGVWGVELLAIRYAAWIKPEFEIEVYEVFKTVVRLGVGAMSRLNKIDHIINTETKAISQCASQMAKWGVGGRKDCFMLHVRERQMKCKCICPAWCDSCWLIQFVHYGSTAKQPKPVSGEITLAATER